MNWGNVYQIEFEQPVKVAPSFGLLEVQPVKVVALDIVDAITKAQQQQQYNPIVSAKLILSAVQW